jgi:hypothetical protein
MYEMERFMSDAEQRALRAFASLAHGNPFLPERVESERAALGRDFIQTSAVWHVDASLDGLNPNLPKLAERAEALAAALRRRLDSDARPTKEQLGLYEGLVYYLLFQRYEDHFYRLIEEPRASTRRVRAYARFLEDVNHYLRVPSLPVEVDPPHLFALGFQTRRAFHHTYRQIFGGSMPAARLRAAVWQSIFTHDVRRYRRALYERMGDIPTLIIGESGTGKELVARAIGLSRYIPFDEGSESFKDNYASAFHAVNLSALSSALVESELFGHRRGSFTGAVEDRAGWLEICGMRGTIFLDEIGELEESIQVKLLRVLQSRILQRIGETQERSFQGKIIAATNRDLEAKIESGQFRRDFYYRLCADVVETPSLREQLADQPEELRSLVLILARRIAGEEEGESLAEDVVAWIEANLPHDYPWLGNVRELEQCARNVLVRQEYRPLSVSRKSGDPLVEALGRGELSADELLRYYCTRVYLQAGSYEEAARRLSLDRRTVKARVDPELLAKWSSVT